MTRHIIYLALLLLPFTLVGCGSGETEAPTASIEASPDQVESAAKKANKVVQLSRPDSSAESPAKVNTAELFPRVRVSTSEGDFVLQLNAEKAPRTVENFLLNYVERSAYDQTIVHYVDPQFMVALGGFNAEYGHIETRTPIYNESDNELSNKRATVAMARLPDYEHSATSEFFINMADNTSLDYKENEEGALNGYCVFGEVVEGMEVVERIAQQPTVEKDGFPNTPAKPIVVTSIRREK